MSLDRTVLLFDLNYFIFFLFYFFLFYFILFF